MRIRSGLFDHPNVAAILKGVAGFGRISTRIPDGRVAQTWWKFTVIHTVRLVPAVR